MLTISTRQLKQNPAQAISQVLAEGEPAPITAYGKQTGVVIAPQNSPRRRWVSGRALMRGLAPLPDDDVRAWQAELSVGRTDAFGRDIAGDL